MVQFQSINFFSWISSILEGFSKVPVFLCHLIYTVYSVYVIIFLLVSYYLSINYHSCIYSLPKIWFPEHGTSSCLRTICEGCDTYV